MIFNIGLIITVLSLLSSLFDPYPKKMTCSEYMLSTHLILPLDKYKKI